MPVSPAQLQAEFTAYLDRTGFDRRQQWQHQAWVALSMALCLWTLWPQLQAGIGGERAPFLWRNLLLTVSVATLTACTFIIYWCQDIQLSHLRRPGGSVAGRAERVAIYLRQRDSMLFLVAVLGQAVVWLANRLGVHLLSLDAPLVLVNLLPTVQHIWLGFVEIPNRKRLLFLYKLVALHEQRFLREQEKGHVR